MFTISIVSTVVSCVGLSEMEFENEVVGVSVSLDRSLDRGTSTVERFVSGCSAAGVLAFLFPRSRLVIEGLLNAGSDAFPSLLLDAPFKIE